MWGVAASIVVTTTVGGPDADATVWLYRVAAGLLVALAALNRINRSTRTAVIWFKVCPILLSASAAVLVVASRRQPRLSLPAQDGQVVFRVCDAVLSLAGRFVTRS